MPQLVIHMPGINKKLCHSPGLIFLSKPSHAWWVWPWFWSSFPQWGGTFADTVPLCCVSAQGGSPSLSCSIQHKRHPCWVAPLTILWLILVGSLLPLLQLSLLARFFSFSPSLVSFAPSAAAIPPTTPSAAVLCLFGNVTWWQNKDSTYRLVGLISF